MKYPTKLYKTLIIQLRLFNSSSEAVEMCFGAGLDRNLTLFVMKKTSQGTSIARIRGFISDAVFS